MERIRIDLIRLDGGTQPRGKLSQSHVRTYAEALAAGTAFPPVDICYDGDSYWLWDGFHRVHAHRLVGREEIDANVAPGTQADAQWLSYSANKAHGLHRSNKDKCRAVTAALQHPMGAGRSDREIADHVDVHFETVAKYRKQLEEAGTIGISDSRTGRDGRTIKTARIGRPKKRPARRPKAGAVSKGAFQPVRGHSSPPPMVPLSLPPGNPVIAANTLIELFDAEWLSALVKRIKVHLESTNPK